MDAQAVYSALIDHYTKSMKASLDQSQLMIYITTSTTSTVVQIGDCLLMAVGMDLLHLLC